MSFPISCLKSISETSFFGKKTKIFVGDKNKQRFYGTSDAAPNVAALELLALQSNPELAPNELYKFWKLGEPGFDFDTGHGFVNGYLAVLNAKKMQKKKFIKRMDK